MSSKPRKKSTKPRKKSTKRSKTPFTDFLNKTKHKDFSRDVYQRVLAVFKQFDLNEKQIRAFIWGSTKEIQEEVKKEYDLAEIPLPSPYTYGPPRPNSWPMGAAIIVPPIGGENT